MNDFPGICPHCETRLNKWRVPEETSWSEPYFYVCFNNDCSYYIEGWVWMEEQYKQKASYRYMINPSTGGSSSLPVWSDNAAREMIVDHDEGDRD